MKKLSLVLIVVLICLFVSGCDGSVTRAIRHAGFNVDGEFKCDVVMPENKKDTSYEKIRYMIGNYMILEDGTLYELSLGQPYASKQNCKKADTDKKVVSIFDDKYFKSNDDKYYYLTTNGDTPRYSEVPQTDNTYLLVDLLLKDATNVKVVTGNSSTGEYYALKNSGDVYKYTVVRDNKTRVESITSTVLSFNKNNYGGSKIIDFNYAGDSLGTFAKTLNNVYRMRIVNSEKCTKYADVVCKYKMKKDELFQEYGDRVIFFNGSYLITDYGRKFSVSS